MNTSASKSDIPSFRWLAAFIDEGFDEDRCVELTKKKKSEFFEEYVNEANALLDSLKLNQIPIPSSQNRDGAPSP